MHSIYVVIVFPLLLSQGEHIVLQWIYFSYLVLWVSSLWELSLFSHLLSLFFLPHPLFFLACHPSLLVCTSFSCCCAFPFPWPGLGTNCSLVLFLLLRGRWTGLFSLRMKWLLQRTKHVRRACEWRESLNLLSAKLCSELLMCLWVSYDGTRLPPIYCCMRSLIHLILFL